MTTHHQIVLCIFFTRDIIDVLDEDAQFLKEDIVLGLIVWLIILSFVVFAIFFLLICLFFRLKRKQDG